MHKRRLLITRDEGRRIYNYIKKLTNNKGQNSNFLYSVEDCNQAILNLIYNYSCDEKLKKIQEELIKENQLLQIKLNIEYEENRNLMEENHMLFEENRNLKLKNLWHWG